MNDKDKRIHSKHNKNKKDANLWESMTEDVVPLKKHNDAKTLKKTAKIKSHSPKGSSNNIYINKQNKSKDVDYRTHTKLKRGQMHIDGRIDLHGMTQSQAYDALLCFIPRMYSNGNRCVLVITGKGGNRSGDASLLNQDIGILRRKTPEWLNNPPLEQYILKIYKAKPNHGGDGALYVLLRRNKN